MAKSHPRPHSRYSSDAVKLLGTQIKIARKERRMTAVQLAERAGISRGLLQRIEKGDMNCSIGAVFEVAAILGIELFDADQTSLANHIHQAEDKLSLLPKSIRKKTLPVIDDF